MSTKSSFLSMALLVFVVISIFLSFQLHLNVVTTVETKKIHQLEVERMSNAFIEVSSMQYGPAISLKIMEIKAGLNMLKKHYGSLSTTERSLVLPTNSLVKFDNEVDTYIKKHYSYMVEITKHMNSEYVNPVAMKLAGYDIYDDEEEDHTMSSSKRKHKKKSKKNRKSKLPDIIEEQTD